MLSQLRVVQPFLHTTQLKKVTPQIFNRTTMKHMYYYLSAAFFVLQGIISPAQAQTWTTIWNEKFNSTTYESCYATAADTYWANCLSVPAGPRNGLINGNWEVVSTNLGVTQSPADALGGRFLMYWSDGAYGGGANVPSADNVILRKSLTGLTIGKQYKISYKVGGLLQLPSIILLNPATIGLTLNGSVVIAASAVTTSWITKTYTWTATSTTMNLSWTNSTKQVNGNDFALDDLLVEAQNLLMPVTLTSFTAHSTETGTVLQWETAQETNSSHYVIQRAADAIHFSSLGRVQAGGNSSIKTSYHFTDTHPCYGPACYRLSMIDIDGTQTFSPVRIVGATEKPGRVMLSPNPVSGQLFISNDNQEQTAVVLFSATGNIVKKYTGNTASIDMSIYPDGVYFLAITDRLKGTFTKQVLKQ